MVPDMCLVCEMHVACDRCRVHSVYMVCEHVSVAREVYLVCGPGSEN